MTNIPTPAKLWHGGVPGLKPGMWILPPSVTGIDSCRTYEIDADLRPITRKDRIYLVDNEQWARTWAVMGAMIRFRGRASVYEVECVDEIELDPDYVGEGERSFMVPKARVVRGYDLSQSAFRRAVGALGYDVQMHLVKRSKMSRVLATYEARA
jgi:hypothetical protein